ncbi:hypothetical protein JCM10212_006700 [Sporobolomyces blumeae]
MLRSPIRRRLVEPWSRSTSTPRRTTHSSTPHPALTLLPTFLSPAEQGLVLSTSLKLLDSPSRTTSLGRKRRKAWIKANPTRPRGFMHDDAYEFEQGHFDQVIRGYREMLVRDRLLATTLDTDVDDAPERRRRLADVFQRMYNLLPPPRSSSSEPRGGNPDRDVDLDPPPHLIMHLLHLASNGRILPHVDNVEAFGHTIVGVSLGRGERVMRFKQVSDPSGPDAAAYPQGPSEFEIVVAGGSAYVQKEPLRTHYTHEVLDEAIVDGRTIGGSQRLSIMLRDRLPINLSKPTSFSFS